MSRVFVFEQFDKSAIDTRKLADFGPVVFLFDRNIRQRAGLLNTDELTENILQALRAGNFDPDADLICLAGPMLAVVQLTAVAVSEWGAVKFLLWDSVQRVYTERELGYVPAN